MVRFRVRDRYSIGSEVESRKSSTVGTVCRAEHEIRNYFRIYLNLNPLFI